jgi:hypothetical protein
LTRAASKDFEREVEAEIRSRQAQTQTENRLADLARRRDQMARKLGRTIDAMLDAEELSPVLRAKAGEYQTAVAELDREIAAETASLKGRTAVGEWREARRYLLDIDVGALWFASTVEEQREMLGALFSRIVGARDRLIFYSRGIEFPVEVPWQQQGPGGPGPSAVLKEVAGARIELRTPLPVPFPTSFSLVVAQDLVRSREGGSNPQYCATSQGVQQSAAPYRGVGRHCQSALDPTSS